MNLIERIKYRKTNEYQDYKKVLEANKKDIERFALYYKDTRAKLDDAIKKGDDAKLIKNLTTDLQRWYYEYQKSILESNFIRPNSKEEIDKRDTLGDIFPKELSNILGSDSNLRFHGTPIYFAKEIIKSGTISSSADRFAGYIHSTDESGFFSASTIDSLSRTIDFFTDFASYNRCLPCGVLFVLNEKEGDSELRSRSQMHNIDFKKNPEQLVGIVCTDEVKDMAIKWCNEYNMDSTKVFSYYEFLEYAKENDLENNKQRLY
ncbi:MAG: hypothetical protein J6G98_05385 [Bacilli bacterium]|nr:hypothetical protein [Bacilli bacterium]